MATLVQSKILTYSGGGGAVAYDVNPTAGHLLVLVIAHRSVIGDPSTPTGWTRMASDFQASTSRAGAMFWREAPGGPVVLDAGFIASVTNERRLVLMEFDLDTPSLVDDASLSTQAAANSFPIGNVTTTLPALIVAVTIGSHDAPGAINMTGEAGYTQVDEGQVPGANLTPFIHTAYRSVTTPTTYAYTSTGTTSGGVSTIPWGGMLAAFQGVAPFVADFIGTPRSGTVVTGQTLAVAFTDLSDGGTGTPDAWLWDFGDGTTSTLQNPTHDFPVGIYTISLTVTTDDSEMDSLTRTGYIVVSGDYEAPEPGGAILEIYAAAPGAPRWDVALWDVDAWSEAGWQDVTPQGIDVSIRWGSASPESGILTETESATWLVNTYDPDRLLDPGNADGPYVGDLRAGLPIRLRHLETVIRQGICETIAYYHAADRGAIRATDNVSTLARTPVPADSVLSDTLRARARDAISAAGLAITVEPDPPSGDPALAPQLDGDHSVWRHIHDAAQQTLNIAYVDRLGVLKFRPWAAPYDRSRSIDSTQLIDLGTIVQTRGLYSVVQVRNLVGEGDDIVERSLTPTPRYGKVTYLRDEATPDSDAWADAVLADRGLQTIQYIPGDIYPLTADAVQYYATLEAVERLGVQHPQADPPVAITGIIVGGDVRVRGKKDSAALWRFSLELAQTAVTPLIDDFNDPGEFLLSEGGDEYLYAG